MSAGASPRRSRLVTVLGFTFFCLLGFGWLATKAGGNFPIMAPRAAYQVSFETNDVRNLLLNGDVKMAGVKVGTVESRRLDDGSAKVTIALDEQAAPLHVGATVQIGVKSLVGTSYVDVTDGAGSPIANGTRLPDSQVKPAVDVDELYSVFNEATNNALRDSVRSLGTATRGTAVPLDEALTGAGALGNEGRIVLEALADQSAQLRQLTVDTRDLLDQLDQGRGQIVDLVSAAQKLTRATSSRHEAIESTMRQLPGLVSRVRTGAGSLEELSGALAPVADDLRAAAPDLSTALTQLPPVTADLNGLLPSLDTTLVRAPATLDRVPAFDRTLRDLVPAAQVSLSDLDPMLSYLAPYGLDLGVLFGSFGGSFDEVAEDGIMPIRLTAQAEGPATVRGIPVKVKTPLEWTNPYPGPGEVGDPRPFTGKYPRVERDEP